MQRKIGEEVGGITIRGLGFDSRAGQIQHKVANGCNISPGQCRASDRLRDGAQPLFTRFGVIPLVS